MCYNAGLQSIIMGRKSALLFTLCACVAGVGGVSSVGASAYAQHSMHVDVIRQPVVLFFMCFVLCAFCLSQSPSLLCSLTS